ncbi:Uncharacterised protein [Weissella viridescens]|uniref:Uncharacterized protein n=1 Tax=Weissella viridescens TaxID=1629 RepID=A0A380P176_WEIVI|nr:Uncharacterised protein [Weissella viridescens]
MVAENANGFDIVYGARNSRETDSAFKRGTAECSTNHGEVGR